MANNRFGSAAILNAPASDGFAIVPNDGADLQEVAQYIYVGGAGNLVLITAGGTTLTFSGLAVGTILPIRTSRVMATNTTATNLIGMV